MADQGKLGRPWSDDELDIIVGDYFAMLEDELSRRPYVKSHHSAVVMKQIGRTHRSVEFKHQNISAVLEELGLPWIQGYKPKRHYQAAIIEAVDRYLSPRRDQLYTFVPPAERFAVNEPQGVFVQPPSLSERIERPRELEKLVRKFDPGERDFHNRTLGVAGEEFVVTVERQRLRQADRGDLANRVKWISAEEGDGAGYDILSFDADGRERLIEVKTTNGAARTPFFITRNECEVATSKVDVWQLYRVHQFASTPRIFTIRPPLEAAVQLRPETWLASFVRPTRSPS